VAKDKDKGKGKDDDGEKSNLVPAVIIAVAAILSGKFAAAGGGAAAPATAATATTIAKAAEGATGTSVAGSSGSGATTAEGSSSASTSTPGAESTTTVGATPTTPVATTSAPTTAPAAPTLPWSYTADNGPVHWATVSPDYALCGKGTKQSPVDIKPTAPLSIGLTDIAFSYTAMAGNVSDDGNLISAVFGPGEGITVDGVHYDLKRAVFHTPSEHTFDGKGHAGELQLVHSGADSSLSIISLLIDVGPANKYLEPILGALPSGGNTDLPTAGPVELGLLLPEDRSAIRYEGSLTTPPCTEGVHWLIVRQPITMSKEQLAKITAIHNNTVRPPQALNGRPLLSDSGPDH
jgi:carbonic anhydrase